jgi:hypothetical protein
MATKAGSHAGEPTPAEAAAALLTNLAASPFSDAAFACLTLGDDRSVRTSEPPMPPPFEDPLEAQGCASLGVLLTRGECEDLARTYDSGAFRSRVVMARHGYGRGEYKYFANPLPAVVSGLRERLYPTLVPIANRWEETLGTGIVFPASHTDFLARCHEAGQDKPTPLLLRYAAGDYNCLHQDLYGELVFPLQVAVLLSEPGADFEGGEFVMTEQRPRMQSRPMVVPFRQGEAIVFAVHRRPVMGTRGVYRVQMRHGVSALRSGVRHTLGIIFHDAA